MNILVTGGSGMIGSLVIKSALLSPQIDQVISVGRSSSSIKHEKLVEIAKSDFSHWQDIDLTNVDAVLFCLGAYTGKLSTELFKQVTIDYPVALATELKRQNPSSHFVLLSGQGADRTEKSSIAFARFKGMAENQIAAQDLALFNSFRPSYIYPVTPRAEPNFGYKLSRWLYPVFKLMGKRFSITSEQLAQAMLLAVLNKNPNQILENKHILESINA